jgi:DMSO/TMAO reductase YedYZ molybdopterin-dependent catalytic subunit
MWRPPSAHPMTTLQSQARLSRQAATAFERSATTQAAVGGILAALLAGIGMLFLRSALQVRTVPERVMEWLLLFIPLGTFEAILQRFGFDAKRYALGLAVAVTLVLLALLGYVILRRRWSIWAIAAMGVGLWLGIMLVVMPVTAAGFFAMDLLDGKRSTIGGYLAICLTYAATLGVTRLLMHPHALADRFSGQPHRATPDLAARRAAFGLVGGAAVAYLVTYLNARLLPARTSVETLMLTDPQEPVPSGGIDAPNPHPNTIASQAPVDPVPTPQTGAVLDRVSLPEPSTSRQLTRDTDGAVLPSGRRPGELADATTPNDDFYIVTKNAAGDPVIHPEDWRLLIDGEVQASLQLDYAHLRKLPAVETVKTLECISNFVGKPHLAPFGAELISTAVWKGVRVRDILGLVGGAKPDATWVAVLGADEYSSALPLQAVLDSETLLVYEMNGDVLPREHGYPARLLVPDRYGMKSPKWVVGLRPMRREFSDWYGQRHWSKEGLVRTMTRIDAPAPGALVAPGEHQIAGIAYAGRHGIGRVEHSADGGATWQDADIEPIDATGKPDRWVRWRARFTIAPGASATLVARATDGSGARQVEAFSLPEPDGGTGWPSIEVRAA